MTFLSKILIILIPSTTLSQVVEYDGVNILLTKKKKNHITIPYDGSDYAELGIALESSFKRLSTYSVRKCFCSDYKSIQGHIYTLCDCYNEDETIIFAVFKEKR